MRPSSEGFLFACSGAVLLAVVHSGFDVGTSWHAAIAIGAAGGFFLHLAWSQERTARRLDAQEDRTEDRLDALEERTAHLERRIAAPSALPGWHAIPAGGDATQSAGTTEPLH